MKQKTFFIDVASSSDWRAALQVQLGAWAPWSVPGFAVFRSGRHAVVWAWDASALAERVGSVGLGKPPRDCIPEPALQGVMSNGLRLCRCVVGLEAQYWLDGTLMASRWWPTEPDSSQWLNFQRGAGLPSAQQIEQVPAVDASPVWQLPLLLMTQRRQLGGTEASLEHAVLAALFTGLGLVSVWLVLSWMNQQRALDALDAIRRDVVARHQPVQLAREDALAQLETVKALSAQVDHPSILQLMGYLAESLGNSGAYLKEFEWQGGQIRLSLSVPSNAARADYVRLLEAGGWLADVRELQDGPKDQFVLQARLARMQPLQAASNATPKPVDSVSIPSLNPEAGSSVGTLLPLNQLKAAP